uniref:Integrase catalytic domain-containing protein n=1 Tax=Macrostomum lignano TaxID=282301 RepID=A0A1I8J229_9PLAT
TPKEAWDKLQAYFERSSLANKLFLNRKLQALKMVEGASMQEHVNQFKDIVKRLSAIGQSYDGLITALESRADDLTMNFVLERLLHEESKRLEQESCEPSSNSKALVGFKRQQHQSVRPKDLKKSNRRHQARIADAPAKDLKDFSASDEEDSAFPALSMGTSSTANESSTWIVDRGATNHMTNDRTNFEKFEDFSVLENISLADGHKLEATGKGTVRLYINTGSGKKLCELSDVLYVPLMEQNLFSVSAVTRKGFSVQFSDDKCQILSVTGKIVGEALKVGRLYKLKGFNLTNETASVARNNSIDLWHQHYGHLVASGHASDGIAWAGFNRRRMASARSLATARRSSSGKGCSGASRRTSIRGSCRRTSIRGSCRRCSSQRLRRLRVGSWTGVGMTLVRRCGRAGWVRLRPLAGEGVRDGSRSRRFLFSLPGIISCAFQRWNRHEAGGKSYLNGSSRTLTLVLEPSGQVRGCGLHLDARLAERLIGVASDRRVSCPGRLLLRQSLQRWRGVSQLRRQPVELGVAASVQLALRDLQLDNLKAAGAVASESSSKSVSNNNNNNRVRCQFTKAASDGALQSLGANKSRTAGRFRGAGVSQQTVDVAPSLRLSPPHLLHRLRTVGLGADDVACQLESPTAQQIARTGQAGAMIERRVGDSLVADLEGGAQQASVRRVDLSLERVCQRPGLGVDGLDHRLEQRRPLAVRTKGSPSKSSATPQILADVGNQTAEVDELLTSWKLTRLSVSASAEDCSLGVHDGLLRVDHQADARRNGNQPIQLSLGALDGRGQQGEVIGVAKHAEPSLRLASTHASPQQEAVVVGRQSSPINRNGASVSPWSTPEDVSKKSDRPSGVETAAVVPWYSAMTAEISSSGTLYARSTSGSASLTTESKAFLKSTKIRIRVNWRMRASSMTRRRARICVTVPRWGRNPFCSGRRYGSSTGCNRDSSMRLNSFAAQDCRQMPRCSSSLVVPGFFGMATMCAVVHSFGATSPKSTRFITLATSVATQWIRSASVGTSSGPSALPPGDCRANFTTSAVLTGATLKLSSAGNGVSGGSLRFSGSGGGGALTMAAKNSRSSFLRSSGVSPARLSAMRRFRPSVDGGPGHAPSGIGPCGRDGLDGVIDSGLLPLQVDSRQSLLRLASWPPTQSEPLQIFPRFVDRGVVLPDRLPALGRSHQRDCLLRSGSNCSAHLRVLGSSTLVAQRSDKGTGKATSRLGVPERAVVAPRWPLWRTVERVPKPKVADEQPMVGPQSQRRNGVAVGDAAALTKAHKHVVELCQPPRSVPAARVPPPPLAAHEGREPARKSSSAPVLPFSRAVTNSDRSDLRRTAFRSPRMTTVSRCAISCHPHRELLEEGLSLIGAGSRRRIRAEQAGVSAAKPDVDPKQPRRQGDAATALLQPRSASRPEACPLVRLGLDAGEPHGPRRHPEDPIGPAQQQLGGRRHVADLASFARDGVQLADARSAALAWSCRIWPPQQLSAALHSHHEEVAAFICTVRRRAWVARQRAAGAVASVSSSKLAVSWLRREQWRTRQRAAGAVASGSLSKSVSASGSRFNRGAASGWSSRWPRNSHLIPSGGAAEPAAPSSGTLVRRAAPVERFRRLPQLGVVVLLMLTLVSISILIYSKTNCTTLESPSAMILIFFVDADVVGSLVNSTLDCAALRMPLRRASSVKSNTQLFTHARHYSVSSLSTSNIPFDGCTGLKFSHKHGLVCFGQNSWPTSSDLRIQSHRSVEFVLLILACEFFNRDVLEVKMHIAALKPVSKTLDNSLLLGNTYSALIVSFQLVHEMIQFVERSQRFGIRRYQLGQLIIEVGICYQSCQSLDSSRHDSSSLDSSRHDSSSLGSSRHDSSSLDSSRNDSSSLDFSRHDSSSLDSRSLEDSSSPDSSSLDSSSSDSSSLDSSSPDSSSLDSSSLEDSSSLDSSRNDSSSLDFSRHDSSSLDSRSLEDSSSPDSSRLDSSSSDSSSLDSSSPDSSSLDSSSLEDSSSLDSSSPDSSRLDSSSPDSSSPDSSRHDSSRHDSRSLNSSGSPVVSHNQTVDIAQRANQSDSSDDDVIDSPLFNYNSAEQPPSEAESSCPQFVIDECDPTLPPPSTETPYEIRTTRRSVISAVDMEELKESDFADTGKDFTKSADDIDKIVRNIRTVVLFEGYDVEELQLVASYMYNRKVEPGDVVIEFGGPGDAFYVVNTGQFKCTVPASNGQQITVRSYDGTATLSSGSLWVLDALRNGWLRKQRAIVNAERFEQGDPGDAMYFIMDGEVDVLIDSKQVKRMHQNEFFGERALVLDEGRAATCIAVAKVRLAKLPKESFCLVIPDSFLCCLGGCLALVGSARMHFAG